MWEKIFKPEVPKNETRAETRRQWVAVVPRKISVGKLMPGYKQSMSKEEAAFEKWKQMVDKAVTPQEFDQALSFYGKRIWESHDVESAVEDLRYMSYVLLSTKPREKVIDRLGPEDLIPPTWSESELTALDVDMGGFLRPFAHWTHEQLRDLIKQILKRGHNQGASEAKTGSVYRASARFDDQDLLKELYKQHVKRAMNSESIENLRALLGS